MPDRLVTQHQPLKILVLGATGLIGNAIARELVQRGHDVTATCRSDTLQPNVAGLRARVVHGDIDRPGNLEDWMAGQDIVVDAAAPYPLNLVYTPVGQRKATIDYAQTRTSRLIGILRRENCKLVLISTLLADDRHGAIGGIGIQRRMMRVLHPYFAIKRTIERRLTQARDVLPGLLIVRPSACLGPYDIKPREQCLVPKLVAGEIKVAMSQRMNLVDTRDVARGVAGAIDAGRFAETIALTGHNTTIEGLLDEIAASSSTRPPRWQFPAALAVLPSFWAEFGWAGLGRPSPLPSLLPILVNEQGWEDTSAAQQSLGVVPRPLTETVTDTIGWYRQLGYC